jgi:hypothetical protein
VELANCELDKEQMKFECIKKTEECDELEKDFKEAMKEIDQLRKIVKKNN